MARAIEAAGFHVYDDRRHEIAVDGCIMTTFVFEDWGVHEKVLWSSFRFDMRFAQLSGEGPEGERYMWVEFARRPSLAITSFEMAPNTSARHEVAMRRAPKPPFEPSPREGVDSYVYRTSTSFMIVHEGHETKDKLDAFAHLFEQYRAAYCLTIG